MMFFRNGSITPRMIAKLALHEFSRSDVGRAGLSVRAQRSVTARKDDFLRPTDDFAEDFIRPLVASLKSEIEFYPKTIPAFVPMTEIALDEATAQVSIRYRRDIGEHEITIRLVRLAVGDAQ